MFLLKFSNVLTIGRYQESCVCDESKRTGSEEGLGGIERLYATRHV